MIENILQGAIQGFTEILPISSSGHLVLFQQLFKIQQPHLFYNVILHLATLFAIIYYYRNDLILILKNLKISPFDFKNKHIKIFWYVIIADIFTFIIAYYIKKKYSFTFHSIKSVLLTLFITGTILTFADKVKSHKKPIEQLSILEVIILGIVQGIAAFPGISRSGLTIITGIYFKANREEVAKFSFFMSIPVIIGASIFEILELKHVSINVPELILGFVVAFICSFVAIKFLLRLLLKLKFRYFGNYLYAIVITILLGYKIFWQ